MGFAMLNIGSTEVVTITPAMAIEMLKNNVSNRKISSSLIKAYSRDMINGEWRTTHQGIALNKNGAVVDGQHRLLAIIDCGIPIKMAVSYYDTDCTALSAPFDLQRRRSISDILGMDKKTVEAFHFLVREVGPSQPKRNETAIMDLFENKPELLSYYETRVTKTRKSVLACAPIRAAVICAFMAGFDWSEQYRAMISYIHNEMLDSTHALYKKLMSCKGNTAGVEFRRIAFGCTYAAATALEDIKVFKESIIISAWANAKGVYKKYME